MNRRKTLLVKPRRYTSSSPNNPNFAARSLENLAASPDFRELVQGEFGASAEMNRRDFLRLLGGTLGFAGLAGVSGCVRQPQQKIVPYVNQPENLVPGKPLYYATTLEFGGHARGVLVETHEGRPTKVEGNPMHPASLGATSVFEQASILDLYNPARSSTILKKGEANTWSAFIQALHEALTRLPGSGEGLHILTGSITSPCFGAQWQEILKRYPAAQWHQFSFRDAGQHPLCTRPDGGTQCSRRPNRDEPAVRAGKRPNHYGRLCG